MLSQRSPGAEAKTHFKRILARHPGGAFKATIAMLQMLPPKPPKHKFVFNGEPGSLSGPSGAPRTGSQRSNKGHARGGPATAAAADDAADTDDAEAGSPGAGAKTSAAPRQAAEQGKGSSDGACPAMLD